MYCIKLEEMLSSVITFLIRPFQSTVSPDFTFLSLQEKFGQFFLTTENTEFSQRVNKK